VLGPPDYDWWVTPPGGGQAINTGAPVGKPFAVCHFHNAVRSLMNLEGPGQVSLSVGADLMVFSMGHLTGNIWMTELPRSR